MGITLASTGNCVGVIVTADTMDSSRNLGGTVRYFAGPLGSASGGYLALTEYASLAAAQTSAFRIPVDGRVDLPAFVDARFVRLYHRSSDGNPYTIYEFVPRRIVQADDIEAESIQAINIAANSITADKITTLTLTGKSIQTAASGARVVLSGDTYGGLIGYGASDTYNPATGTGTYQLLWDKTDGKLYAGGGDVVLDSNGVGIAGPTFSYNLTNLSPVTIPRTNMVQWSKISGSQAASIVGSDSAQLLCLADKITLAVPLTSTASAGIDVSSTSVLIQNANFQVMGDNLGAADFEVTTALSASNSSTYVRGGLNIGTATGAAAGEIKATNSVAGSAGLTITNNSSNSGAYGMVNVLSNTGNNAVLLHNSSSNTGYAGAGSFNMLTIGNEAIGIGTNNAVRIQISGAGAIGFFGSTGSTRPTVTGSRGGNAALASLLSALATLGLITDSSTA